MSRTTINPCLGNWVIVFVWLLILSHFHSLFLLLHPGALVLIGNDATVWLNVSRSLEQQWSIMLIRTSGICGALNTNRSLWYSDLVFFFKGTVWLLEKYTRLLPAYLLHTLRITPKNPLLVMTPPVCTVWLTAHACLLAQWDNSALYKYVTLLSALFYIIYCL